VTSVMRGSHAKTPFAGKFITTRKSTQLIIQQALQLVMSQKSSQEGGESSETRQD
jgi:hypothetical protein